MRRESLPVLLEIKTYRYRGHSMSDPAKYRTKEELEAYKRQDPILILKTRLAEAGVLTEEEYQALDKKIKGVVQEAVTFAEESDEPPLSALYEDILV